MGHWLSHVVFLWCPWAGGGVPGAGCPESGPPTDDYHTERCSPEGEWPTGPASSWSSHRNGWACQDKRVPCTPTQTVPSPPQADTEPVVTSEASEVVPRALSGEPQSLCSSPQVAWCWAGGPVAGLRLGDLLSLKGPWPTPGHGGGAVEHSGVNNTPCPRCSPQGGVWSVTS